MLNRGQRTVGCHIGIDCTDNGDLLHPIMHVNNGDHSKPLGLRVRRIPPFVLRPFHRPNVLGTISSYHRHTAQPKAVTRQLMAETMDACMLQYKFGCAFRPRPRDVRVSRVLRFVDRHNGGVEADGRLCTRKDIFIVQRPPCIAPGACAAYVLPADAKRHAAQRPPSWSATADWYPQCSDLLFASSSSPQSIALLKLDKSKELSTKSEPATPQVLLSSTSNCSRIMKGD